MVGRQAKAIEMSSPLRVVKPLWQAAHRSDVWNCGTPDPLPGTELQTDMAKTNRTVTAGHRKAWFVCIALPPIAQAAVEPVPEQIEENQRGPRPEIVYRKPEADIGPYMLATVQGYLHLRNNVPVDALS